MNILVTGGAGFIGSNLALELERRGHTVLVADNLFTGTKENLVGFRGTFLDIDVSRPFSLPEKVDAIFHIAAITDPRFTDDAEMLRANADGFHHVIELAKKDGAKLVYASTANLYGNGPTPMEETQKKEIISTYGQSKLEMDRIAETLFGSLHIVGLRYFNVFGPREEHKGRASSMIYHLYRQMKEGQRPRLFTAGEQRRDHIYVTDVVEATIQGLSGEPGIYNVGTGLGTSFNELVDVLNQTLGTNLVPEYFDMPYDPKTYQMNTQASVDHAKKGLGWRSRYSVSEGVREAIAWWQRESSKS